MVKVKLFFLALTIAVAGCKEKKTSTEVINPTPIEEDYGGWDVGSFVDNYGDKTGEHYIFNNFYGRISVPHAERYNDVKVRCVIDSTNLSFTLYDYGREVDTGLSVELKIKDEDGNEHMFRGFYFINEKRDSIINLLSSHQTLKFSFWTGGSPNRIGRFSVEGCPNLRKMINNQNW